MKEINYKYFEKNNFYKAINEATITLKNTLFKKKDLLHQTVNDGALAYYIVNKELYYLKKVHGFSYLKKIDSDVTLHNEYVKLKIDHMKRKIYKHGYIVINSLDQLKNLSNDGFVYSQNII